ncbi:MORC family CW-type zinc finger 3b [Elysia marginata]|uniref:MORC family CW-type zinc finger 3b n=1 Tax=Elysia marginata TaxID=1093978 RepID=A0AAV4IEN2_9GAST|nr:MORC family CW-type zinc finger 3b [Elysia marginata]
MGARQPRASNTHTSHTSLALLSSRQPNHHLSTASPVGSIFDLSMPARQASHVYSKAKGVELLHTVRQTKWAVTKAREWLSLHGMNVTFEDFTDEQLDQMLLGFYTSGLKKDGSSFSATALLAFRTALNRYLHKRGRSVNIATSHKFKQSNAVLSRLMSTSVKVNKTISMADIKLMYTSGTLSNSTPESLLYKVWFELQMNFGSKLDWSKVLAEHFFFSHDSLGKLVVTWNTCGLGNCDQMTVIEADDGRYCPVNSLHLYMKHRNQSGKAMLQVPASKDLQIKGVWYLPEDIRDYKEKSFMKKISSLAKLSRIYTNACVLNCSEEYYQAMLSLNHVNPETSATSRIQ